MKKIHIVLAPHRGGEHIITVLRTDPRGARLIRRYHVRHGSDSEKRVLLILDQMVSYRRDKEYTYYWRTEDDNRNPIAW